MEEEYFGHYSYGPFLYYHKNNALGIGPRSDTYWGWNNLQFFGGVRRQVMGRPQGTRTKRGLDCSLEAGASAWGPVFLVADFHLGANLSLGGGRVTPWLSYRHHWGIHMDFDVGPADFRQHMVFLGLEIQTRSAKPVMVELFHGWPGSDWMDELIWGLNVVVHTK